MDILHYIQDIIHEHTTQSRKNFYSQKEEEVAVQ